MIEIIYLVIITGGVIFCLMRALMGPTAGDRAVSLDTLSTVTAALLVLAGYVFKRGVYLDVSLVYAALAFLGSVAIARFLEKGI
ncbi:cation:proton antiporter [Candidatus Sumerlaeota bacterium]|nr:cation:proton antiporter [Candidatus Sumerlaeota bacterium]